MEPSVTLRVVRLPWYRESAFRAWVKNSFSTLGAALAVVAADWASWKVALIGAAVLIAKDFLGSAYDIFFASPDVFEPKPPA